MRSLDCRAPRFCVFQKTAALFVFLGMLFFWTGVSGVQAADPAGALAAEDFVLMDVASSPAMLPADSPDARAVVLTPHCDVLPDPEGRLRIEDIARPASADGMLSFSPLAGALPRDYQGPLWLRLSLLPHQGTMGTSGGSVTYRLRFGSDLVGDTVLYTPVTPSLIAAPSSLVYAANRVQDGAVTVTVSGDDPGPVTLYARLSGVPGLWFVPVVEPESVAAPVMPLHLALAVLLAAGGLMGLLRFGMDRASWRIWGVLLAGTALYANFFPALMPALMPVDTGATAGMLAALIAPGVMLMLIPHIGRYLVGIPKHLPGADGIFLLYPLLGAVVSLAPLVPGYGWLARYLPFWPLFLVPLLFVALRCLARQLPGSLALLALTVLPLLGVAGSSVELARETLPLLGSEGQLWGVALAVLILGLTPDSRRETAEETETNLLERYVAASLPLEAEEPSGVPGSDAVDPLDFVGPAGPTGPVGMGGKDGQGVTVPAAGEAGYGSVLDALGGSSFDLPAVDVPPIPDDTKATVATPAMPDAPSPLSADQPLEPHESPVGSFGEPLARPVFEPSVAAPAVVTRAEEIRPSTPEPVPAPAPEPVAASVPAAGPFSEPASVPDSEPGVFDLPALVRSVYESATSGAEEKGIAVSWFMSPYLGRLYEGDAAGLQDSLYSLLVDVVRQLTRGTVSLAVRRAPAANAASGQLAFTIEVWRQTAARPAFPHSRLAASSPAPGAAEPLPFGPEAVSKAWAFAERNGGIFSLEHTVPGAVNVIFSVPFASLDERGDAGRGAVVSVPSLSRPEAAASAASQGQGEDGADGSGPTDALADSLYAPADLEPRIVSAGAGTGRSADEGLYLAAPRAEDSWQAGRILLTDMAAGGRRNYLSQLRPLGREVLEAREGHDVVQLYARHPSGLLLFDADMPETEIAAAIAAIRRLEDERDLPRAAILTVTSHEMQSARMLVSGSTECLIKPVAPQALRDAVERLAPAVVSSAPSVPPVPSGLSVAKPSPEAHLQATLALSPETPPAPETENFSLLGLAPEDIRPSGVPAAVSADVPAAGPSSADDEGRAKDRTVPLLDLIITDEDAPEAGKADVSRPAARTVAPTASTVASGVRATVAQVPARASGQVSGPASGPAPLSPAKATVAKPALKPAARSQVRSTVKAATAPLPAVAAAPATTAAPDAAVAPVAPASSTSAAPAVVARMSKRASVATIPLEGENDSVNADMLPLIPGLIYEMDDAVRDTRAGVESGNFTVVREISMRLAARVGKFNLQTLERMARCVERAAEAGDQGAVGELFGELEVLVTRYKDVLRRCHKDAGK